MPDYSVLGVVLVFLFFEREKTTFLLYMVVSAVVGGINGVAAGLTFWALFYILKLVRRVFSIGDNSRLR